MTHNIHIIILIAAITYFWHCTFKIDVLISTISLHWCHPEDGNLSLQHVGGFMFMDNLSFCCVHMLVYINDYILICQYKQNVDKYCTVTNTYTSTSLPYQCVCSWTGCTGLLAVVAGTNVQSSVCSLHCLCWDSFQALLHSPASNQAASTCQLHTALPEYVLHEPVTWMEGHSHFMRQDSKINKSFVKWDTRSYTYLLHGAKSFLRS